MFGQIYPDWIIFPKKRQFNYQGIWKYLRRSLVEVQLRDTDWPQIGVPSVKVTGVRTSFSCYENIVWQVAHMVSTSFVGFRNATMSWQSLRLLAKRLFLYHGVVMSSCHHIITSSRHHVIVSSCYHNYFNVSGYPQICVPVVACIGILGNIAAVFILFRFLSMYLSFRGFFQFIHPFKVIVNSIL